jgi:hypothetical protein
MALILGMLLPDFYRADASKFDSPKRWLIALHRIAMVRARIADSSSRNAVSFSSLRTMKRFTAHGAV